VVDDSKKDGILDLIIGGAFLLAAGRTIRGGLKKVQASQDNGVAGHPLLRGVETRRVRRVNGRHTTLAEVTRGDAPKGAVSTVRNLDQRIDKIKEMIDVGVRGREAAMLRQIIGKDIIGMRCGDKFCVPERKWQQELEAIYDFVRANVRYTHDTDGVDVFQTPLRTLQFHIGDCFPEGTRFLTPDFKMVPVEFLREGMSIWGLDRWSKVEKVWAKGVLPVDAIHLNNGSTIHLTGDHHVFVAHCPRHAHRVKSAPCACPMKDREVKRITVAELEPGMVMLTPERLPFGTEAMAAEVAYVEGLYLSDGWGRDSSFEISGQDGCPKEAQKREVESICARMGIETRWNRKYISVKNKQWAQRMKWMGSHAPCKRAPSINLREEAAAELLRGIMADSGANTHGNGRTFTTTSRELCFQVRLLQKMLGRTCRYSYIVDHGGLGSNPIHRLGVRGDSPRVGSSGRAEKLLRVLSVDRQVVSVPTYHLTTDDHYVYLPEADVTVSQCDDGSILLAAMVKQLGYQVKLRVVRTHGAPDWDHIYVVAGLPPTNPKKWFPLDASLEKTAGWEAGKDLVADHKDFPV
jgi:hypothetical protein